MLATRLPANTLLGMMQLCCDQLLDDGNTFYSQRVFDLFPQMATTNSGYFHAADGFSVFGSYMQGDAAANDADYVEWAAYVPAGNYKLKALYTKTSAGGKLDLSVDGGAVIDTLDTYAASAAWNQTWVTVEFALTEGSHTIKLVENGKNGSSSGYADLLSHCQLIKQDATSALTSVANVPHVIDVPVVFADSHTNWNTLSMGTASLFGTLLSASGSQNATVTFGFWAPRGAFTLAFSYDAHNNRGVASISVDGGSIGTVDMYNAGSVPNSLSTGLTGTFASTGMHTITFTMATTNHTGYHGNIHHIQIRMTSITEPLAADLAPEVALFWPVFAEGNTNWSTITADALYAYYHYSKSNDAQNSLITLTTNSVLRPGTYRADLLVATFLDAGKIHTLIDTVDLGSYDAYTAGTVRNVVGTVSGLVLAGFTPHTLTLKMTDKNGSSAGYGVRFVLARLIRTGA